MSGLARAEPAPPKHTTVLKRGLWLVAIVAGCGLALLGTFLGLGRWLEAPGGIPSKADVIVLLGGDSQARLLAGLELYRQGMAPRLLLAGAESGGTPADRRSPNLRLQYLVGEGVPPDAIIVDDLAHSSREEAASTYGLMLRAGWRRALVVSDPPHMRRLSWIWHRAFAGAGASYVLVASKPWWWRSSEWWRDQWAREFVRTEVAKIGYYLLVR